MTLRASLDAVLRKHFILPAHTQSGCTCETHADSDPCPMLVDDLLACLPQPSREALEKLFDRHDRKYDSKHAWVIAMQDALMAWANGQREAACDHRGLIRYESDHGIVSKIRTDLKKLFGECPLCTAPRPED